MRILHINEIQQVSGAKAIEALITCGIVSMSILSGYYHGDPVITALGGALTLPSCYFIDPGAFGYVMRSIDGSDVYAAFFVMGIISSLSYGFGYSWSITVPSI